MRDLLTPLLFFQRFFIPTMLILLVWGAWRTVFKKDFAVGMALYVTLLIVVDGFYNTGVFLPGLEKGSIRYSEICALFLLFSRPPAQPRPTVSRTVLALVGAYFFLMAVAALRADPPIAGLFDFRRIIFPQMLALTLAMRGIGGADDYRRFLLALIVLVLIVAVFCFWDVFFDRWILHSDMLSKPEYWVNRRQGRFGSIFLNPNFLGAFVVLLFPPLFMLFLSETKKGTRLYLGVALLALLFSLIQTQSRGPLVAFAASLLFLVFGPAGKISRLRRFGALAVALLALAMFMPGFIERATDRFDSIERETTTERVSRASIWQYTRQIIAANPLLGVGFGEHQFLLAIAKTDFEGRYGRTLDNPHNSYLQAAVYAGVPALAAFAFANLLLLVRATRRFLRSSGGGADAGALFGLTVGLAGFLIAIYPDMHLFTPNVGPLYWLFFGLLFARASREASLAEEPAARPVRPRPYGAPPRYGAPRSPSGKALGGSH